MPIGDRASYSFEYDGEKVTMHMFMTGDMEKYTEHSLLSQDDIAADLWSVGYVVGDNYYIHIANMRTTQNPTLKNPYHCQKARVYLLCRWWTCLGMCILLGCSG